MLNFKTISKKILDFLNNPSIILKSEDQLSHLIRLNMKTNQKLWDLEDSARMVELGPEYVAAVKQEIDKNNQIRNNLIRDIDTEITNQIRAVPLNSRAQFYSESPGMIIDRLAILYIKISVIRDLLSVIKETDLLEEYKEKEGIILGQINRIGDFLNSYLDKLEYKEIFFDIQQPVKIYNDKRVKEYIKFLKQNRKDP